MVSYDIRSGTKKIKTKAAVLISTITLSLGGLGMAVALPAASHAAYCGASSNGCDAAAAAGAQCGTGAGSGAFGAFGTQGDVVHDFGHVYPGDSNGKPGANGQQTGLNNSSICGNRQGNL